MVPLNANFDVDRRCKKAQGQKIMIGRIVLQFLLLGRPDKERRERDSSNLEFAPVFHPRPLLQLTELFVKLQHEGFEILGLVDIDEVRDVAADSDIETEADKQAWEYFLMRFEQPYRRSW